MKTAAFQFAGSGDIQANLAALERGIAQAAEANVRFLLTQECALTGYPPLETPSPATIDRKALQAGISRIECLAREHDMYIALGTVQPKDERCQRPRPKGQSL